MKPRSSSRPQPGSRPKSAATDKRGSASRSTSPSKAGVRARPAAPAKRASGTRPATTPRREESSEERGTAKRPVSAARTTANRSADSRTGGGSVAASKTGSSRSSSGRNTIARRTASGKVVKGVREPEGMRLNKAIAESGICSRRAADEMIAEGRVKINNRVVTELGTRVKENDQVMVDGKIIGDPERHVYMLLNKPRDVITTTSDEKGRRTVMDLIGGRERIYPVGRLDRHTTGALILTNDGDLANRLMHPSYGVERYYDVQLDRFLSFADAKAIARGGVDIGDGDITQECEIFVDDKDRTKVSILIREGKNREVRRLFEVFGYEVERLNRRMYAGLTTRGLSRGEWRYLDRTEIAALRRMVKLS